MIIMACLVLRVRHQTSRLHTVIFYIFLCSITSFMKGKSEFLFDIDLHLTCNMQMDKYFIIKPIGKGSYGDVYLVRNNLDKKQYVLKKIFIKKANSKEKMLVQQEVHLSTNYFDNLFIVINAPD